MESSGSECDTVTRHTELLITCTNEEVQAGETEMVVEDSTHQQISALAQQYHLLDQNGHAIHYEIQALPGTSPQMMILASESENGQVFHVIPSGQSGTTQLIIPQNDESTEHCQTSDDLQAVTANAVQETSSFIIHSNTSLAVPSKSPTRWLVESYQKSSETIPLNLPVWARRLRGCEKIGDSYRGYCLSESELMNILGLHKQQTMSVWGTRQSPSQAKPATRLMWKSQYVPYDGIPFINAGSRAIVMECQYGPRRKGSQPKKSVEGDASYKATCPARIYIKKVQKFPTYGVPTDPKIDKKLIKLEQEKAFNSLKKDLDTTMGVFRWYVQLPDQDAHQYHSLDAGCCPPSPTSFQPSNEEEEEVVIEDSSQISRLHPCVAEKIRDLVSKGIEEVYAVRKQLRKYVERDLFKPDDTPERHNLSYFPTVNDLKNHIHEAQRALGSGELIYEQETDPESVRELQWTSDNGDVLNEMVTVTFEQSTPEEEESLIKVQTESNDDLCPDTAQLISSIASLQPKIFAQLQGLQLQPSFTSSDGTTALIAVNQPSSAFTSSDDTAAVITVSPQTPSFTSSDATTALITVNHPAPSFTSADGTTALITLNHQPQSFTSADGTTSLITLRQPGLLNAGGNSQPLSITTMPASGHNIVSMGQLVTVEDASGVPGEVHQILLGGINTIPIRIIDNQPTIVEVSSVDAFCTEQIEANKGTPA